MQNERINEFVSMCEKESMAGGSAWCKFDDSNPQLSMLVAVARTDDGKWIGSVTSPTHDEAFVFVPAN